MLYGLYNEENPQTEALLVCLPKISVISSSSDNGIFEATLPCSRQSTTKDTLPWTITLEDFAIITLGDGALPHYICKPLSCKVFLAASNKKAGKSAKVLNIGFVIHADWTSCELFLCKSQVNRIYFRTF